MVRDAPPMPGKKDELTRATPVPLPSSSGKDCYCLCAEGLAVNDWPVLQISLVPGWGRDVDAGEGQWTDTTVRSAPLPSMPEVVTVDWPEICWPEK